MALDLLAVPFNDPPKSPRNVHADLFWPRGKERARELLERQWAEDEAYEAEELRKAQEVDQEDVMTEMTGAMPQCDSPAIVLTSSEDETPAPAPATKTAVSKRKRPITQIAAPKLPPTRKPTAPLELSVAETSKAGRGRGKAMKETPAVKDIRSLRKQFPTISDYARNLVSTPRTEASHSTVIESEEETDMESSEQSRKRQRVDAGAQALAKARILFVSKGGELTSMGTKTFMDGLYNKGAIIHDVYISPLEDADGHTTHIIATREGATKLSMKTILRAIGFKHAGELFGPTANGAIHAQRPWVLDQAWATNLMRGTYDPEASHLIDRKRSSTRENSAPPPIIEPVEVDESQDSQGSRIDSYNRMNRAAIAYPADYQQIAAQADVPIQVDEHDSIQSSSFEQWDDLKDELEQAYEGEGGETDSEDEDEEVVNRTDGRDDDIPDAPRMPAKQGFVARSAFADGSDSDEEGQAKKRKRMAMVDEAKLRLSFVPEVDREHRAQMAKRLDKEKWACQRRSEYGAGKARVPENQIIVDVLNELVEDYDRQGDKYWHVTSTRKAVGIIRNWAVPMISHQQCCVINGIGDKMASKIVEIRRTGTLARLRNRSSEDLAAILFARCYGVGPSLAGKFARTGARTLKDLGAGNAYGIKLTEGQTLGVLHYYDLLDRMKREETAQIHALIEEAGKKLDPKATFDCMGSYRRGQPDCGDIDILVSRDDSDGFDHRGLVMKLVTALFRSSLLKHELSTPSKPKALDAKWMGLCALPGGRLRRIDILGVPTDELGAALIYFTGNDIFNRSLRLKARKMGFSLNQRGVFKNLIRDNKTKLKVTDGVRIKQLHTEADIFKFLGVKWRPPQHRLP